MANSFPEIQWLTSSGSWPSFSPDGSEIVYVDAGHLYKVPAAGGKPELVYASPEGMQSATRPDWSWSPTIAFSLGSGNENTIYTVEGDGSNPQPFPNQGDLKASLYPSWAKDLQSIVVMETTNQAYARLYQIFTAGKAPELLTPPSGYCAGGPSINPSGTAVALAGKRGSFDQENNQIWIVQLPSKELSQLDPEQGRSPNWSPDGNWILFESNRGTSPKGNYQLWVAHAPVPNGPAIEPRPITPPDVFASHGEWSRQQDRVVFDNANGHHGIGIIEVPPEFRGQPSA